VIKFLIKETLVATPSPKEPGFFEKPPLFPSLCIGSQAFFKSRNLMIIRPKIKAVLSSEF
jgi:hypothetical protein